MASVPSDLCAVQDALRAAGWFCFDTTQRRPSGSRVYTVVASRGAARIEATGNTEWAAWRTAFSKVRKGQLRPAANGTTA